MKSGVVATNNPKAWKQNFENLVTSGQHLLGICFFLNIAAMVALLQDGNFVARGFSHRSKTLKYPGTGSGYFDGFQKAFVCFGEFSITTTAKSVAVKMKRLFLAAMIMDVRYG
ncbi:hypothetical protein NC652_039470 [Populus alba x Populus x berolinensis]|nr:hypothetical protein NC652_039470 [Populus alba x Populus x berolinensis]